jgi:hypothetical protein
VASRPPPSPQAVRIGSASRLARLVSAIGTIFFLATILMAAQARADWHGSTFREPTAEKVCEDIADDWANRFHGPTIVSFGPGYGDTGRLIAYNCLVLAVFSFQVTGTPVQPICSSGDFVDTSQPTGCSASAPTDPKDYGPCGNCAGGAYVANPVSVGIGNKFESVTDYTTADQNPLAFIRYYNGLGISYVPLGPTDYTAITGYTTAPVATMGTLWSSNYDRNLTIVSASGSPVAVRALRPGGQVIRFVTAGGGWQGDSDISITLTQAGTTWTLTDKDDTVETYTTDPASNGTYAQLNTIHARNGYTQTLTYTTQNGNSLLA